MSEDELSSCSEESENNEDTSKHDELISKISKLGKKRKLEQREEPSTIISEHHLSNVNEYHVDTEQLLSVLSNKKGVANLKSRLTKVDNKTSHLLKPLPSHKKDQIQRKVAFEEASAKVSKWESIVKHNRKAAQLSFPLQANDPPKPSLAIRVESFKPQTSMEVEIANVLKGSENDLQNDQELTEAEQKALLKLSLQEAKERRAELRKMRSLVSAYEQKQRRISRIKSKKFHKVQRKRKEKIESKINDGDNETENKLQRAERLRAKERATLKHSRMSKWAKEQLARNHRDPSVKNALKDQSILRQELKQKEMIEENSSDNDVDNDVVSESEDEENHTHLTTDPSNAWLTTSQSTSASKESLSSNVIDPKKYMKSGEFEGVKLQEASDNLLAVQEAFAGDDVVEEFLKDKLQDIEEGKPMDTTDDKLPGWGSWAGLGVKKRKRKQKQENIQNEETKRQDSHLKYVILNHKRDKKLAKHQVSKLPYPLSDEIQFKKTMAAPLGRHWNTETRHSQLIKPRIQTSIGSVIQPIRMTNEVKQFISKSAKAKRRKFTGDSVKKQS